VNLATLRNRVQSTLGLKTTGNELTLLDGYLNEGYEDVLARTRCRVNCGDLTTTDGVWKYRMPSGSMAVLELWAEADGAVQQFERTTSRHILDMRMSTASTSSGVRYYAVEGHDLLILWPTPTSVENLAFFYVPRPTPMSATADTPSFVPAQWHRAVELYAAWKMADYDDDGSSQVGQMYRVQYEGPDGRGGILRDITQNKKWQGGRRLAPARAGRRPSWRPSSRAYDA
jgi:hypothetical protein